MDYHKTCHNGHYNKVLIIKLYPCATNGGNVMVLLLVLLVAAFFGGSVDVFHLRAYTLLAER
jgi:hypothetical protein